MNNKEIPPRAQEFLNTYEQLRKKLNRFPSFVEIGEQHKVTRADVHKAITILARKKIVKVTPQLGVKIEVL